MKSEWMLNPIDPGGITYQANGNIRDHNKSMSLPVILVNSLIFSYRFSNRYVKIKGKNFFYK